MTTRIYISLALGAFSGFLLARLCTDIGHQAPQMGGEVIMICLCSFALGVCCVVYTQTRYQMMTLLNK